MMDDQNQAADILLGDVVRLDDVLVHLEELVKDRTLPDDLDLLLDLSTTEYAAHWITPMGEARRFDTRFFVTEVLFPYSCSSS